MFLQQNTLSALWQYAKNRIESAWQDENERESIVRLLFAHYLNIDRAMLISDPNKRLSESEMLLIHHAVKRLEKGEPVQYVIGEVEFYGLRLKVTPDVLIPRPETEEMVDRIVKSGIQPKRILDVCSGSGCIALALKKAFPEAEVRGIDISPEAVSVSIHNAKLNQIDVQFIVMDATKALPDGTFDLIVSNPPYVPASERLEKHVFDHEPHLALFVSDENILQIAAPIAQNSLQKLTKNGQIWFEFHRDFVHLLAKYLDKLGYANVSIVHDLSHNQRFCSAIESL